MPDLQGNADTGSAKQNSQAKSPELVRLEAEKVISAAAAEIAANWSKQLKESLPSKVGELKGDATISGDPIECQILSYQALDKVAEDIATKIASLKQPVVNPQPAQAESRVVKTVAIYNEQEIIAQSALRAFEFQLVLIEASLRSEIEAANQIIASIAGSANEAARAATESATALGLAPMAINTALRSAADLVSLFRMDVTLNYKSLTIGDSALVAAVTNHLIANNISVYHSALVPMGLFDGASKLMDRISKLIEERSAIDGLQIRVAQRLAALKAEVQRLTDDIAGGDAATPKRDTPPLRTEREKKTQVGEALTLVASRLQLAGSSFDAFQSALFKADGGTGGNALVGLLRAEKLGELKDAHRLVLKIVAAGGGYKTKRVLWWTTTKILYSGGTIAEFTLFDGGGRIVCSNISSSYTGFIQVVDRIDSTKSQFLTQHAG